MLVHLDELWTVQSYHIKGCKSTEASSLFLVGFWVLEYNNQDWPYAMMIDPHIFAVAEEAYKQMARLVGTCIVIAWLLLDKIVLFFAVSWII